MPSGSHSGSSGSHSSGGSSFGGGSNNGGFSFGGSNRPPRPIRTPFRRHGTVLFIQSNKLTSVISLVFVSLFIALFGFLIAFAATSSVKKDIAKIEIDYTYYQDMIEYAEAHTGYVRNGKIIDKFKLEDSEYWYLTYSLDTDDGKTLEGYTFSVYKWDQVKNYHVGDDILIAVNSNPVTLATDSINVEYKNTTLNDDGEYVKAQKDLKTFPIIGGAMIGVAVVILVVGIVVFKKNLELEKAKIEEDKRHNEVEEKSKRTKTSCPYCGAKNDISANKCSSCGGSLKEEE